jgi:hypothetical protein
MKVRQRESWTMRIHAVQICLYRYSEGAATARCTHSSNDAL